MDAKKPTSYSLVGFCLVVVWLRSDFLAERQGFEPWEQLPVHRISSAARSTTPASFLSYIVEERGFPLLCYAKVMSFMFFFAIRLYFLFLLCIFFTCTVFTIVWEVKIK